MLYTVAICLLVGMLLLAMVMLQGYTRLANDRIYFQELAQDNLASGMELVVHGEGGDYGEYAGSLLEAALDSYVVALRPWGVYAVAAGYGKHGPARAQGAVLVGQEPQGVFAASLFLQDRNQPLQVCGKTAISGTAYLPTAGIRAGQVGRRQFEGQALMQGKRLSSHQAGLMPDYAHCKHLAEQMEITRKPADHLWHARPGETITRSWQEPTLRLYSSTPITIDHVTMRGNVMVSAPVITIGPQADLEHVQLVAHGIRVQTGFAGKVQLFATDSLVVEEACTLRYPSAAVLTGADEGDYVRLEARSVIEGALLADAGLIGNHNRSQAFVTIATDATVVGNVIVAEHLDLQGAVIGNVHTGKFRLIYGGGVYENTLLDARIGMDGRSADYLMPCVQPGRPNLHIIQALEGK